MQKATNLIALALLILTGTAAVASAPAVVLPELLDWVGLDLLQNREPVKDAVALLATAAAAYGARGMILQATGTPSKLSGARHAATASAGILAVILCQAPEGLAAAAAGSTALVTLPATLGYWMTRAVSVDAESQEEAFVLKVTIRESRSKNIPPAERPHNTRTQETE